MSDWADIIAVAVEDDHIVGLLNNGTVVATGDNEVGQCDVSNWTDVIAVAVNYNYTIGLRSNGTVIAVGDNDYGQCDVINWVGIKLPPYPTA